MATEAPPACKRRKTHQDTDSTIDNTHDYSMTPYRIAEPMRMPILEDGVNAHKLIATPPNGTEVYTVSGRSVVCIHERGRDQTHVVRTVVGNVPGSNGRITCVCWGAKGGSGEEGLYVCTNNSLTGRGILFVSTADGTTENLEMPGLAADCFGRGSPLVDVVVLRDAIFALTARGELLRYEFETRACTLVCECAAPSVTHLICSMVECEGVIYVYCQHEPDAQTRLYRVSTTSGEIREQSVLPDTFHWSRVCILFGGGSDVFIYSRIYRVGCSTSAMPRLVTTSPRDLDSFFMDSIEPEVTEIAVRPDWAKHFHPMMFLSNKPNGGRLFFAGLCHDCDEILALGEVCVEHRAIHLQLPLSTFASDMQTLVEVERVESLPGGVAVLAVGPDPVNVTALRALLSARSEFFRAMFRGAYGEESVFPDETPTAVRSLLNYLATDRLPRSAGASQLTDLCSLAHRWGEERLERLCARELVRRDLIVAENVVELTVLAHAHGMEWLLSKCRALLQGHACDRDISRIQDRELLIVLLRDARHKMRRTLATRSTS